MDTVQGQPIAPSSVPQAEPATPAVPENLFAFIPDQPAEEPQVLQGQEPQTQPGLTPDAHFQSLYNRQLAENMALQQRLQTLEQQRLQPTQAPMPDPQTDPVGFVTYTIEQKNRQLLEEVSRQQEQRFQQLAIQAAESQWMQAHPQVDTNLVKAYNRANGIVEWNLEAGYRLMQMPQQMAGVQSQAAHQALTQFRQSSPAQPIRQQTAGAVPSGGGAISLSFEKLLTEYTRNPGIYEGWDKPLQQLFDRELMARRAANAG